MEMNSSNHSWNIQQYAGFCLTTLLLCFILTSARFARTNFSGEWTLKKEKSKLVPAPGQMRMVFDQLKVTQNGNEIIISRTSQAPDGQALTMDEKITLDGKESVNNFFDGAVTKKSITKWSANEKELNISSTSTFTRGGKAETIKSTEVWENATGTGELTIKYTASTPKGEVKDIYIYIKK
ncbi:hypothetical protein [Adhaeribacter rhizoryzae]|uniref:Uncharacterized protein n=1 Tax=Adhaeribacter rhizoryzae TaxID=2607907 RepID=A0A5M6D0E8_9BACT|nr:hypothetical protein [Adhaeribacter rhizoryzae]KAA5538625.1 hypothetical protein F0145_25860 [Adhaeribacter rhizoryzae]